MSAIEACRACFTGWQPVDEYPVTDTAAGNLVSYCFHDSCPFVSEYKRRDNAQFTTVGVQVGMTDTRCSHTDQDFMSLGGCQLYLFDG